MTTQRRWAGQDFNSWAIDLTQNFIKQTSRALACEVIAVSGAIVTVKFLVQTQFPLPQVTMPLFGPIYIRYPIQVGDMGVCFPADMQIGGISGLSNGVGDFTQPPNLSALVFFPIGNKNWPQVDSQSVTILGPNGVTLYDTGKNSTFVLTPNGIVLSGKNQIVLESSGASVTLNSSGVSIVGVINMSGDVTVTGNVTANGNITVNGTVSAENFVTI